MCGIAGLVGADAARHERTVGAIGASHAHRGPDGTMHAASSDGRAVLAMNTLMIVDPQAMPGPYLDRETGVLLACRGEIYNYRQQATACGIPLGPRETDAHFALRAFAKISPSCLDGLHGMFALAVYDPRIGRLFLARNRLSEKPLYWHLDGGRLTFASEVATLTGYGPAPLVLRPEVLAIETPGGIDTPFQDIQMLPPATVLTFDIASGSLDQHTYWNLAGRQPFEGTYAEALANVSVVLAEQPAASPGLRLRPLTGTLSEDRSPRRGQADPSGRRERPRPAKGGLGQPGQGRRRIPGPRLAEQQARRLGGRPDQCRPGGGTGRDATAAGGRTQARRPVRPQGCRPS
ncbi:hypothetical protein [Streptomyces flaveolus]|uniref:hypothetical protein n=1 Tax=Streptomyces flaveolus TaxID=67297 RepID=UPI003330F747